MNKTEYEMPDEYKKNLAILLEFIESREMYLKEFPNLTSDEQALAKPSLDELDCVIDEIETALAAEYEQFQAEKHREATLDQLFTEAETLAKHQFIIIKHTKPKLFEQFKKITFQDMSVDEIEDFYDEIAILEATGLDKILGRETV
jgi:hypothetical protein